MNNQVLGSSERAIAGAEVRGGDRAEQITIDGVTASVHFNRFDLENYKLFLRCKRLPESQTTYDWELDTYTVSTPARFIELLGIAGAPVQREGLPIASYLFDYEQFIVRQALDAQRYAIYADCGLGKTAMFLEWARHVMAMTGGKVLIFSPLQIISQTQDEALKFYGEALPVLKLDTRAELEAWLRLPGSGLAITNYDKMIPGVLPDLRLLTGLICDESSILKTGGGVIKWNLIKSCKGIQYKLSCTATPAPNEIMEYASQAAFLEKLRTEGEILWTFFSRDKRGNWRIKPHAKIVRIVAVMALTPWITYQILTKRAKRLPLVFDKQFENDVNRCAWNMLGNHYSLGHNVMGDGFSILPWPLPNVWLGVSVENQPTADERIPELLRTPAAVRFVSYEPALGPVNFHWLSYGVEKLDWIIAGGESGPGARPSNPEWFRSTRDRCQAAGVPFFFKQWGEHYPLTSTDGIHGSPFGGHFMSRVGKKKAGALLDGKEWRQMPQPQRTSVSESVPTDAANIKEASC